MRHNYENFVTKVIQRNLNASRQLKDPGYYYPITTFPDDAVRGSKGVWEAFFIGMVIGAVLMLFIPGCI
jgi:hypothetical protein